MRPTAATMNFPNVPTRPTMSAADDPIEWTFTLPDRSRREAWVVAMWREPYLEGVSLKPSPAGSPGMTSTGSRYRPWSRWVRTRTSAIGHASTFVSRGSRCATRPSMGSGSVARRRTHSTFKAPSEHRRGPSDETALCRNRTPSGLATYDRRQTRGGTNMGAQQDRLGEILRELGFSEADKPPRPKLAAMSPEAQKQVMGVVPCARRCPHRSTTRNGCWDSAYTDLVVELDESAHFNLYRAVTPEPEWAQQLPWRSAYLTYTTAFEGVCRDERGWGGYWTNTSAEQQFGPPGPPRDLEGAGSPRWKQRALCRSFQQRHPCRHVPWDQFPCRPMRGQWRNAPYAEHSSPRLDETSTGVWWVTTTGGTVHVWNLDAMTLLRAPGAASLAGEMRFDGDPQQILAVGRYPVVGTGFLVAFQHPTDPNRIVFRESSDIVRIERPPHD